MTCSVYSEYFFYIVVQYFILSRYTNKLVIAKNVFVYVPGNKKFTKSFPSLQYSARE